MTLQAYQSFVGKQLKDGAETLKKQPVQPLKGFAFRVMQRKGDHMFVNIVHTPRVDGPCVSLTKKR
jgi:hypothetical protein